jgi:hypothetical protein
MTPDSQTYEYDFALILTGITELTPGIAEGLLEAGCDDGTIAMRSGRPFITFSRRAPSIKDAILSAIENVRNANVGVDVLRVDYCNLVTQSDIARKIGHSRQLVHQYMTGARGPGGFPAPACGIVDDVPLWYWCEVADWLWQNNMVKEGVFRDAEEVELINNVLELMRQEAMNPALAAEVIKSISPEICH